MQGHFELGEEVIPQLRDTHEFGSDLATVV
jgi:hypothetical protein